MISALQDAMNDQIRSEFAASAQYVAIAVHFDDQALPELAGFFYRQAEEERVHAMKFVQYMLDAGVKPMIPDTPSLRNSFDSPADAVGFALEQERTVTAQINQLVTLAVEGSDYATHTFLQWFVTEQVEEVATMTTLLQTIHHAGGNLLQVEEFVRRFTPASPPGAAPAAG